MYIASQLKEIQEVWKAFVGDEKTLPLLNEGIDMLTACIEGKHKIISCGNGGSHCDAMHFAEELSGKFRAHRIALPALCISDAAHISCVGNDYGFDEIFSRFIAALGKSGDILLAISTSGESENIIKAALEAKSNNMLVMGLTGKDGGRLSPLCDWELRAPPSHFSDRVQEIHIKVIHILIGGLEKKLNLA